jgi:hypothetical protein
MYWRVYVILGRFPHTILNYSLLPSLYLYRNNSRGCINTLFRNMNDKQRTGEPEYTTCQVYSIVQTNSKYFFMISLILANSWPTFYHTLK